MVIEEAKSAKTITERGIDCLKTMIEQYQKLKSVLIRRMQMSHLHLFLYAFRLTNSDFFLFDIHGDMDADFFLKQFNPTFLALFYRVNGTTLFFNMFYVNYLSIICLR